MQTNFFAYRLLIVVLIGIFISYLIQGLSPLRINTDSVAYLHMARSAWLGQGFMVAETTSYFPKGYSALLSLLHSIGLATPFIFVLLNTLFLFSGAFVYYFVFRNEYGLNRVQGLFLIIFISLNSLRMCFIPL